MAWLDQRSVSAQAGLDRELKAAFRHLRGCDPVLASVIEHVGPCELRATRNHFQVMLETIVSQQLSTLAARAIYARLAAAMGGGSPRPERLLELSDAHLLACGLSRSKVVYVRNVARAFAGPGYERRHLARMSDEEVAASLTSIKGVGAWSAHMFLIFALNRLDVFPVGDLGLRKAMMARYRIRAGVSPRRFDRIAEPWRPYRTIGTLYMWRSYDAP